MMLRPVSYTVTRGTPKISNTARTQKARDKRQPRRVKDIKKVDKQTKKYPRLFWVKRKDLTFEQQRKFALQVSYEQLKALRDSQGFFDNLLDVKSLNDAQIWILHAADHCEHLYPLMLRKQLEKYITDINFPRGDIDANSKTVQQLVAYEHNLDGLLSLLALCRRYDIQE
jgi:hypothetical protein